jgi:hypothetical protein
MYLYEKEGDEPINSIQHVQFVHCTNRMTQQIDIAENVEGSNSFQLDILHQCSSQRLNRTTQNLSYDCRYLYRHSFRVILEYYRVTPQHTAQYV